MGDEGADYSNQSDGASGNPPRERYLKMQLTEEELRVLRECRTNSLYLRGLPLGVFSIVATRYLAHNFFPHIRNWAGIYYTSAFTMGMIAGVMSYREKCFSKIMNLDNSRLADEVRKFQKMVENPEKACEEGYYPFSPKAPNSQEQEPSYQATQRGKHGPFRNSNRGDETQSDEESGTTPSSYEELRKRNRERRFQGPKRLPNAPQQEVENAADNDVYDPDVTYDRRETYSPGSSWDPNLPQTSYEDKGRYSSQQWSQTQQDRLRKNKYGDEME